MENELNKESYDTKFIRIGLKMREKSLFENRQKFTKKFGENKEFWALKTLITHLNLI